MWLANSLINQSVNSGLMFLNFLGTCPIPPAALIKGENKFEIFTIFKLIHFEKFAQQIGGSSNFGKYTNINNTRTIISNRYVHLSSWSITTCVRHDLIVSQCISSVKTKLKKAEGNLSQMYDNNRQYITNIVVYFAVRIFLKS